jgi:hypothetical protein
MDWCTFCDRDGFRRDSVVFAENDFALFGNLEDGGPLSGSGVIVPKAHRATVFDLSADEFAATFVGDEPRSGYGIRWWLRQPENTRPDPEAPGTGRRDFDVVAHRRGV